VTVGEALQQGTAMLESASVPAARLTAEVLLTHALHRDRSFLYAHGTDELPTRAWIHFGRYLDERLKGKPTQYITHLQEFYSREYFVDEHVLIPRPETEHLVELALEHLKQQTAETVLDVGTGSGAIAISVAVESSRTVIASDVSVEALRVAERNRSLHHASVSFFAADLLEAVQPRSVDLLLSNPPYVPGADSANMQPEVRDWEPHVALFAGASGLEIYMRLIEQAERVVKPGGRLMMELGFQSLEGVRAMLITRWTDLQVVSDLAGWPRVIAATLTP
jgi:release factor glutamine methyltransferase